MVEDIKVWSNNAEDSNSRTVTVDSTSWTIRLIQFTSSSPLGLTGSSGTGAAGPELVNTCRVIMMIMVMILRMMVILRKMVMKLRIMVMILRI